MNEKYYLCLYYAQQVQITCESAWTHAHRLGTSIQNASAIIETVWNGTIARIEKSFTKSE